MHRGLKATSVFFFLIMFEHHREIWRIRVEFFYRNQSCGFHVENAWTDTRDKLEIKFTLTACDGGTFIHCMCFLDKKKTNKKTYQCA